VSTKEQTENLSLPTQLLACEEYCRRQGYEVLERFHEEGESAKTTDRSQLQNLLTYCVKSLGLDQPSRLSAHIASDRHAAAKSALRRDRGCPGVRRSRKARGLRAADLRGLVLPRAGSAARSRAQYDAPAARDFPLRTFVRCESCGRGLTGSWSKGRREYYAYYHCRPGWRAVNVTKAKLEGLFADELALLQPTPGYMRLLKESVLQIWKARKAAVSEEIAIAERAARATQNKLNRLDEAFLFERFD
jgi:hypothetical protein